ncbi:Retrovirus-related Pol polyprotein from transposon TNT 1-94 [Glycine max]|nr:Retrovirus-related Pol polyprotein from transposon TNT 1-94 [Glycine max]
MRDDLKKLRDMNKDGANSQASVVKNVEDEDDVFLATNDEVAKTKWVMNSAASKHICRDREMFNTLKIYGEFSHFKLQNGGKMKVKGIGSVRMKLHDGVIQTFSNVRFVPSVVVSMISMGEMTSQRYKYVS